MSLKGVSFEKRTKIADKMQKFRGQAENGNEGTFARMTESERLKIGKHWIAADEEYNKAHGKFCLTINEALPIVLDIAGTEENNPTDITVRNVKAGKQKIAELLTVLTKKVMDDNDGDKRKSQAFERGVTVGRSFIGFDINYDRDPENGDFELLQKDSFLVLPDPACKSYDYNDRKNGAKYIIVDDWEDKEAIENRYPKKKKEIQNASFTLDISRSRFGALMSKMFGGRSTNTRDDYRDPKFAEEEQNLSLREENNHRVTTIWWKEYKKGAYIQKISDPLNYIAVTKPTDIAEAKRIAEETQQFKVITNDRNGNKLTVPVLNRTVMVGDVLVDHVEDPFDGMSLYPIVRFAPYFDDGYEFGVLENVIGPQKLINYFFTNMANNLKKLANTGWLVGGGSPTWLKWLKDHGTEDGVVIDKSKFGNSISKIVETPFQVGMDAMIQRTKEGVRETTQVRTEEPVRSNESGKAREIKEGQNLRTKGVIFRNWNFTNNLAGRVLIELIRNTNVFSEAEILELVDEERMIDEKLMNEARAIVREELEAQEIVIPDPPQSSELIGIELQPPEMQAALATQFQQEAAAFEKITTLIDQMAVPIAIDLMMEDIKNMQKGRYGIKIDVAPRAPTIRMKEQIQGFALNDALRAGGQPGLSRDSLIDLTEITNKEKIKTDIPQVQGAA